eukprot:gene54882-39213_t
MLELLPAADRTRAAASCRALRRALCPIPPADLADAVFARLWHRQPGATVGRDPAAAARSTRLGAELCLIAQRYLLATGSPPDPPSDVAARYLVENWDRWDRFAGVEQTALERA